LIGSNDETAQLASNCLEKSLLYIQKRHCLVIDDAIMFVFAVPVFGCRFTQQEQRFAYVDIPVPRKQVFHGVWPLFMDLLARWAGLSCAWWAPSIPKEAILSFRRSWSHRRAALQCFGSFIERSQRKGVDFEMVERRQPTKPENFIGSSQGMPAEVVR
jgi:hypothetical protein